MKRFLFLLVLFSSSVLWAHPHVWIDSKISVDGDSVTLQWQFDEMFSNILFSDYDIDRDHIFVGEEVRKLKADMFDNLVNFDYFIKAYCGNELMDVGKAEDFKVTSTKTKVSYTFKVNLPFKKCRSTRQFYNHDDTYYSDISVMSVSGRGVSLKDDTGGRKFVEIK